MTRYRRILIFIPILLVRGTASYASEGIPVAGATSYAGDGSQVADECSETDEALFFLQRDAARKVAAEKLAQSPAEKATVDQAPAQLVDAKAGTDDRIEASEALAVAQRQIKELTMQVQFDEAALQQERNHSAALLDQLEVQRAFAQEQPSCALYVGILSAPENRQRRDAVRSSWLNQLRENAGTSRQIIAEFVIGHTALEEHKQGAKAPPQVLKREHELAAEAEEHGDIHRILLPELYQNLPDKTYNVLQLGLHGHCNFLLKIDDDRVLNVTTLMQLITKEDPHELLYAGSVLWDQPLEYERWKRMQLGVAGTFAPYFGGPCYLLSGILAQRIVKDHVSHTARFLEYGSSSEDVTMGHWVDWESELGANITYKPVADLASASAVSARGEYMFKT